MIPADARTGTTVGKYKLHEIVGRGGMGVVYRGEHVYIGKEVAVKILHEGYGGREESIKRFLREARAASLINHPNIVDVTDFGKSNDGTVFFVMELLDGEALDVVLQRDRRLDLMRSITIVNQMAGALGSAHSKGIVHRDLKPENVMLIRREGRRELIRQLYDDEGGTRVVSEREKAFDFVKILDFGVAKVRDPDSNEGRVTQQGVVFGTPEYMAPETARVGISDPRTDIYALGIMFYEMLTGTVPFTGETPVDVMLKVVSQPVISPRQKAPDIEITPEAERLIMKALSKDPLQRHQTMEELFNDLQQCYGSVRYRRQIELRPPEPIQLQNIKRPSGSRPVEGDNAPAPSTIPAEMLGAEVGAQPPPAPPGPPPILLTKRKERKRTLPMEIGVTAESPKPAQPSGAAPQPPATLNEPHWIDSEENETEDDTEDGTGWSDIDIDAPDGTRG
jgi:serine/threonine protein kinase